jgi:hypothetical protein
MNTAMRPAALGGWDSHHVTFSNLNRLRCVLPRRKKLCLPNNAIVIGEPVATAVDAQPLSFDLASSETTAGSILVS